MKPDDLGLGFTKGLEVWTLQTLCNATVLLSFLVLALVAGRVYVESVRKRLYMRVVMQIWEMVTDIGVDLMLLEIALITLFILTNDVMADIKVALPWMPAASVLLTIAMVLRLYYGGRETGSRAWKLTLGLISAACASNWFGYTFIVQAAGDEYLAIHPNAHIWVALARMGSDKNPDLAMQTFLWANPLLILTLIWGLAVGVSRSVQWSKQRRTEPLPTTELPGIRGIATGTQANV